MSIEYRTLNLDAYFHTTLIIQSELTLLKIWRVKLVKRTQICLNAIFIQECSLAPIYDSSITTLWLQKLQTNTLDCTCVPNARSFLLIRMTQPTKRKTQRRFSSSFFLLKLWLTMAYEFERVNMEYSRPLLE